MSSELRAYQKLKKLHPSAHFQRIETWAGVGIFDCNACKDGVEVWIEFKNGRMSKKGIIKAKVRKAQKVWQMERERRGGRTFVGLMLEDKMFLLPGYLLRSLSVGMPSIKLIEAIKPEDLFKDVEL